MTEAMDRTDLVVRTIAQTAIDNEKYFGDLDSVVGDGDFGYSLARGFEKLLEGWDDIDRSDPGTFLKKVGMMITSRIGGTSGTDLGHRLHEGRNHRRCRRQSTGRQVVAMLRAAIEGIKARGQSDVGDKTLIDALVPMTDGRARAAAGADATTALAAAAATAREAAEATKA